MGGMCNDRAYNARGQWQQPNCRRTVNRKSGGMEGNGLIAQQTWLMDDAEVESEKSNGFGRIHPVRNETKTRKWRGLTSDQRNIIVSHESFSTWLDQTEGDSIHSTPPHPLSVILKKKKWMSYTFNGVGLDIHSSRPLPPPSRVCVCVIIMCAGYIREKL
jgi:hypothetical protein